MKLRESLKALMALKGVKKRDLSEALNIPWNTLNRYFNHQNDLSSEKFNKVLHFMGIDIFQLINKAVEESLTKTPDYKKTNNTEDIIFLLDSLDDIEKRIFIDNLVITAKSSRRTKFNPQVKSSIEKITSATI